MQEPNPAMILAYLDQVRATIAEHGWAVQVAPAQSAVTGETCLIAYTVGLTERGRPELLLMDPETPQRAAEILDAATAIHLHRKGGLPPEAVFIIHNQEYVLAELPVSITAQLRVLSALYDEACEVLMLASAQNYEQAIREREAGNL